MVDKQKERLFELLVGNYVNTQEDAREVVEHLIHSGVIVAPCKIGTPLYMIVTKRAKLCKSFFSFVKKTKLTYYNLERVIEGFGEDVFLTKAEADAKLKEMQYG